MADDTSGAGNADDGSRDPSPDSPDVHDSSTGRDGTTERWDEREFDDRTGHDGRISVDTSRSSTEVGGPDDEYRIPLDLSETSDDDPDDAEADPYGPEPSSTPVEAGDPELENVLFVVLGALAMLLVIFQVVSIPL
ncbi:DUF7312 domain-containing protein [Natronorubrum sulfidifaciens]|uniref:DUF7312 domain-containing protein n=1 Tax=Natronorubrum sulfidifaciens JCM 14089 TaxID=1230460 RepID=L9W7N9_9EURY|nr:hypothetical protein [Natronorubrum sulfidifaciens]ELY44353.1 hypothetical protein C495_10639 [Natronorubrum sulfidifaciens JCM 14089]